MVTVGKDVSQVERRLAAGLLVCPRCGGRLGPWGHARTRRLRGAAEPELRPRRTRCAGCGGTHVLLPVNALLRRADEAVVIGAGVVLAAAGVGTSTDRGAAGSPGGHGAGLGAPDAGAG